MPLEAIPREKILAVIEKVGPVQPLDVRRELGEGDTMLIGAIASEMVASGMIAITKTKRGGSPFYYNPQHPASLERLNEYLNEKDQRTFVKLREAKVLREDAVDPLTRVSLSNIPDFSRSFTVDNVRYWRYYLVPEAEAKHLVAPPKAPEQQKLVEPPKKEEKQATLPQPTGTFAEKIYALGNVTELKEIKHDQEVTCKLQEKTTYGSITYVVYAFSRKTLPETLVWKALLNARSKGLPLLILKDSPFPKSLQKKFSDVENVFFKRI